ncbi:type II toxin-antitoxin system antitoxin SocA domain-containing protein [Staphylococcus pseudintermedius]
MKVHNLIYYVQETSLALSGKPIIDEQFEVWVHGSVLLSLRGLFVFY